eukprot:COSAG01_NODE_17212_length_1169_cov_3.902804_1_plen_216_part_00
MPYTIVAAAISHLGQQDILLEKRIAPVQGGTVGLPGGKARHGEPLASAQLRELHEEISFSLHGAPLQLTAKKHAATLKCGQYTISLYIHTVPPGRAHYRALIDSVTALGPHPRPSATIEITAAMRDSLSTWHAMLAVLNTQSAVAPAHRPLVPGEIQTDSSFSGWGWVGCGMRRHGPWPKDWTVRIGRISADSPDHVTAAWQRIWICELELICCV